MLAVWSPIPQLDTLPSLYRQQSPGQCRLPTLTFQHDLGRQQPISRRTKRLQAAIDLYIWDSVEGQIRRYVTYQWRLTTIVERASPLASVWRCCNRMRYNERSVTPREYIRVWILDSWYEDSPSMPESPYDYLTKSILGTPRMF